MPNTDLRIVKTKQNIRQAFLSLMKEKSYESITVKEIADRACVNRKTFYFHYETKNALYNEIAKEITAVISPDELLNDIQKTSKEGQRQIISHFLIELKKIKEICTVFLNDVSNPEFNNIFKIKLSNTLLSRKNIQKKLDSPYITADFLIDSYYDVFRNVLKLWLDMDCDDPNVAIDCLMMVLSDELMQLLGIYY